MRTVKRIVLLIFTILLFSCSLKKEQEDFTHHYVKYWDKYTKQQLIDTLFSDTLIVGMDTEGGWTTRKFYSDKTKALIADLQDDSNKTDSLFPMMAFDALTIRKIPFGFKKTFTKAQTEKFLEIINDPVSFNWSETTYDPEFQVDFLKDNKVVRSLTIGADRSIVKPESDWPDFKKMKFGRLKSEPYNAMKKVLDDVGP